MCMYPPPHIHVSSSLSACILLLMCMYPPPHMCARERNKGEVDPETGRETERESARERETRSSSPDVRHRSRFFSLPLSIARSLSLTLSHSHSHSLTHTHSKYLSLSRSFDRALSLSRSLSRAHLSSVRPMYSQSLSRSKGDSGMRQMLTSLDASVAIIARSSSD